MIRNYIKIAWRNIFSNKKTSAINIIGLALGLAVVALIGLWVNDELSFNKKFKYYSNIAQVQQNVTNNGEINTWNSVPYPLAQELRTNYGSDFEHVVMAGGWSNHIITNGENKIKLQGGFFEEGAAEMFSLTMKEGVAVSNDPAGVVISETAAKACFGNESAIGKTLQIDKMPPAKITGVYKNFPANSALNEMEFLGAWKMFATTNNDFKNIEDPWRPNFVKLFVQVKENVSIAAASLRIKDAKLKNVNAALQQKKPELFLHPMSQWQLYSEFKNGKNVGGSIQYVKMFAVIGIFVLLLACINFINLSTARSEKRAKEVGIRKTVGSSRSQLISQFFTESMITVLLSFILAVVLVWLAFPYLNTLAGKQIVFNWANPFIWISCLLFLLFTVFVSGCYPAFYLSSFKPIKVLKGNFKGGRFAGLPRKFLVVLQFTISIALITGTVIVYRQIDFAQNRSIGYSKDQLLSLTAYNDKIHTHFKAFEAAILQAGVASSVAETESPLTDIWNTSSGISWQGKDPNLSTDFGIANVSKEYGRTIGWKIKEGRDFSKEMATDSNAVILNEAAVKYMGLKNPVGTTITSWDKPFTVIAVVQDMVMKSPYSASGPVLYAPSDYAGNFILLKLTGKLPANEALAKVETIFKQFNTEQPFEFQFADEDYAKKFNNEVRVRNLASVFTILAVIISCLGLFGLTSFVVAQREKEIGVRKVLGASVFSIWNMLSRDFVMLVLISFLISVPLAYYFMNGWLQNYSYHTHITWWIFAGAGAGALLITLAVVSIQATKASLANPVKSLRSE